jgi:hypothetical protein
MAAELTMVAIGRAGIAPSAEETQGEPTNGHSFQNAGRTFLRLRNADAGGPHSATVAAQDGESEDVVIAVPASSKILAGPFRRSAYNTRSDADEVQILELNDIAAADTFKLTFNGHESGVVTYSADMHVAIQAALVALVDFDAGDVVVARVDDNSYKVTFGGAFARKDAGPITVTSPTGFTPTGVTETTKGRALGRVQVEVDSDQLYLAPFRY